MNPSALLNPLAASRARPAASIAAAPFSPSCMKKQKKTLADCRSSVTSTSVMEMKSSRGSLISRRMRSLTSSWIRRPIRAARRPSVPRRGLAIVPSLMGSLRR